MIGLTRAKLVRFIILTFYCFSSSTKVCASNDEVFSLSLRNRRDTNKDDDDDVDGDRNSMETNLIVNITTTANKLLALHGDKSLSTSRVRKQKQQQQQQYARRNLFFLGGLFDRSENCPPPNFDALQDFDINLYLGRWYAHKQIPVAYQSIDQFYCVTADYTKDKNFCPFCNYAPRIDILNQARQDSVNGTKLGGANRFFRGIIRRPRRDPAKITVGFFSPFLPKANYWVVAAGLYEDILVGQTTVGSTTNYEWAIISGGSPVREGMNGKCKPNPGILNFLGMWMFLRDSDPLPGVIEAIDTYASNVLGLDTTAWLPVQHEGCVYD
jgi:lipocalin